MKSRLYRDQYLAMVGMFCMANLFLPGMVAKLMGKAAFVAFVPGYFLGMLLILLHGAALRKSPGGICAAAKMRWGKYLGSVAGAVYLAYFLWIGGELMSYYGLYLSGEMGAAFYLVPIALAVIFAGGKSTTVLGRAALIFAVIALALAIPLGISGFIAGNVKNLYAFPPVDWREAGWLTLSLAALEAGQLIAIRAIAPAEKGTTKMTLIAAAIGNGAVLLIAFASILIEGQTPLLNDVAFFSYTVQGGVSQLRIIAEGVLFFCAVFRIAVCLRAAGCTARELFCLREERPIVAVLGGMMFALALCFAKNIADAAEFILWKTPYVSAIPLVLLPLLLWIFSKKKQRTVR